MQMNDTRLPSDDPKLTAYALGELNGDERAAVEAALRENPALRLIVEEIRATSAALEAALGSEPIIRPAAPRVAKPGIIVEMNHRAAEPQPRAIVPHSPPRTARQRPIVNRDPYRTGSRSKLLKFPQSYYLIATAAAACFAVLVAFHDKQRETATRRIVRDPAPRIAVQPSDLPGAVDSEAIGPRVTDLP
jgi:anti-sigma factor RsiW